VRGALRRGHRAHGTWGGATDGDPLMASVRRSRWYGNQGTKGMSLGKVVGGGTHESSVMTARWLERRCMMAAAASSELGWPTLTSKESYNTLG
jgi:hypothetical protein